MMKCQSIQKEVFGRIKMPSETGCSLDQACLVIMQYLQRIYIDHLLTKTKDKMQLKKTLNLGIPQYLLMECMY